MDIPYARGGDEMVGDIRLVARCGLVLVVTLGSIGWLVIRPAQVISRHRKDHGRSPARSKSLKDRGRNQVRSRFLRASRRLSTRTQDVGIVSKSSPMHCLLSTNPI